MNWLLDDDLSLHMRMQAAEIIESAGTGERKGVRIVSIERLRSEGLVLIDHIMRDVVVIDPFHRRSDRNRQLRWTEGEVVNRHLVWLLCRDRSERQQRAGDRTEEHRSNDGATGRQSCRSTSESPHYAQVAHQSLHDRPRLAGQRIVDEGERFVALRDRDGRQSKLAAELIGGNKHRPGRRRATGSRLRERRRQRGVEGHVAFDLLRQLVDVAVEDGNRSEPLQQVERTAAVLGAPAPLLVEYLHRDMGEHDDWRAVRLALQVSLEPGELLGAEIAETAALQVDDVDEADEVDAVIVE